MGEELFPFIPWSKAGQFNPERAERIRAAELAVLEAAQKWDKASTPNPISGGIDILATAGAAKELRDAVRNLWAAMGKE